MDECSSALKHKKKGKLKRIFNFYIYKWWAPTVSTFLLLGCFFLITVASVFLPKFSLLSYLALALFILFTISFLGILIASIWNFIVKKPKTGFANLLMLPASGVISVIVLCSLAVFSMFGPSDDGFADNLIIPEDIEIAEPMSENEDILGGPEDAFQMELLASLQRATSDDVNVTVHIPSLVALRANHPDVLDRYLATSPSWRVFTERGNSFATRRWMIGSNWQYSLHGYYTDHDLGGWKTDDFPGFQSRLTLGFSGKPWVRNLRDSTLMEMGQTSPLQLSMGNRMHESHCVISQNDFVVEIFEQSEAKERRLTKAALLYLEKELSPLAKNPDWTTIKNIFPNSAVKQGVSAIHLRESFQPGLYDSEIWGNPGEPGMIYLKAYEVTKETRLSADRLKVRSNEWVGWSDNPEEQFFSNTHFTIYEGDWGKPYAARFEVWFVPDSGEPERKLMEKTFKIEGWQR